MAFGLGQALGNGPVRIQRERLGRSDGAPMRQRLVQIAAHAFQMSRGAQPSGRPHFVLGGLQQALRRLHFPERGAHLGREEHQLAVGLAPGQGMLEHGKGGIGLIEVA